MSEKMFVNVLGLVGFAGIAFEHWIGGIMVLVASFLIHLAQRYLQKREAAE